MAAAIAPTSVGQIETFITMLHAACSEKAVYQRLEKLLTLPNGRRQAVVHAWVNDLLIEEAPQDFIQAVACLLDDRVAEKAYEVIYQCQRPSRISHATVGSLLSAFLGLAAFAAFVFLLLDHSITSSGAPPPRVGAIVALVLLPMIGVSALMFAYRTNRHARAPRGSLVAGLVIGLSGAALVALYIPITGCKEGMELFSSRQFDSATKSFSYCLVFPALTNEARIDALNFRGWAHFYLGSTEAAIADREAILLVRQSNAQDFVALSVYLRRAGKLEESLDAVVRAEKIEYWPVSAYTLYNKGWVLYDLKRYEEAMAALDAGLMSRPEYPAAYVPRGLAREALGNEQGAREDFETAAQQFSGRRPSNADRRVLPVLRQKLLEHGLLHKYALPPESSAP